MNCVLCFWPIFRVCIRIAELVLKVFQTFISCSFAVSILETSTPATNERDVFSNENFLRIIPLINRFYLFVFSFLFFSVRLVWRIMTVQNGSNWENHWRTNFEIRLWESKWKIKHEKTPTTWYTHTPTTTHCQFGSMRNMKHRNNWIE